MLNESLEILDEEILFCKAMFFELARISIKVWWVW